MSVIEPVKTELDHPGTTKKYSSSLRLWHWLNAVVISGSLITVLINSTILDDRPTAAFLKSNFKDAGATLTDEQTKTVAHALSDSVWEIHVYFGYALAALLAFRIVLEFFQIADQKLIRGIKSAYHHYAAIKKQREAARHELVVKSLYAIFYLLLIIMVVTGLFLAFEDFFAPYKAIRHSVKEFHGFCMYLIIGFIVIHIAGVFLAERKDSKGIVSDMINGGK
ncbi:MAG TPA: cytochrome b/b6 domain-containing protein [Mucilaginibacter sp.]|jgi:cytochrome b561|nr:cytochrome b/b6 domain-containing protein [Mucilaginibacter sp.]